MKMAIKIKYIHTNNTWLDNKAYSKEEQHTLYDDSLQDVLDNTRWYLDNLDYLREYRVYWGNYNKFDKKGLEEQLYLIIWIKNQMIYKRLYTSLYNCR